MNPSILVVDDEPVIQQVLEFLLTSKGFLYIKCLNGKEAFEAMSDLEYNLVILDLNLPDINGLEIAAHLEENHPNTPILFITGDHSATSLMLEDECKNRTDRQFIYKPITSEALYPAIEELIEYSMKKGGTSNNS
ncbi:MAG: response regulator [Lentisphaeraceae bacterium]|nr:response regulator [Lentisphaeraceae bacterium]